MSLNRKIFRYTLLTIWTLSWGLFSLIFTCTLLTCTWAKTPNDPIWGRWGQKRLLKARINSSPQIKNLLIQCQSKANQEKQNRPKEKPMPPSEVEAFKDDCFQKEFAKLGPDAARGILNQADGDLSDPDSLDNTEHTTGPVFDNLATFLQQRLEEELYGKSKSNHFKQTKFADHQTFYDLYNSQLGKNVLTTINSYCVNADEKGIISASPEERTKRRKINIAKLSEVDTITTPPPPPDPLHPQIRKAEQTRVNKGYIHFGNCLGMITHICGQTQYYNKDQAGKLHTKDYSDINQLFELSPDDEITEEMEEDADYTRRQACIVTNELKRLRRQTLELQKVDKKLKELSKNDSKPSWGYVPDNLQNVYGNNNVDKEKTLDDLSSLTSNEFASKASMELKLAQLKLSYERECEGSNFSSDRCRKMMGTLKDHQKFSLLRDEYVARTEAMKNRIEKYSEAEVQKFLINEGRTQQEVQQILDLAKRGPATTNLQKKIAEKFKKERMAVIEAMSKKLRESSLGVDQDPARVPKKDDKDKDKDKTNKGPQSEMSKKYQRLKDRLTELGPETIDILVFNNIVSGHLVVQDKSGMQSRNSKAAFRELKDNYYNPAVKKLNITPAIEPAMFQKIQATTKQMLNEKQQGPGKAKTADSITIEVPTLNREILGNYLDGNAQLKPNTQQEGKKKDKSKKDKDSDEEKNQDSKDGQDKNDMKSPPPGPFPGK